MHKSLAFLVPAVFAAAGCAAENAEPPPVATAEQPLVWGVPQKSWLLIGADELSAAAISTPTAAEGANSACSAGSPSELARLSARVATDANGLVGSVLDVVGTITAGPPAAHDANHAVWGPITSPESPAIYRLDVERAPDGAVAFVLSARPKAVDAWRPLFRGATRVVDADHRAGEAQVDFGAMHDVDPTNDPVQGSVGFRFGNVDGDTVVEMAFGNVAGKIDTPKNALYKFQRRSDGVATFEFAAHDFSANPDRLLHVTTIWSAGGAGRARAVQASGGAPVGGTNECWTPSGQLVFKGDEGAATPVLGDAACCAAPPDPVAPKAAP